MKVKKVLIVGNCYSLVKAFSKKAEKVFVVPGNSSMSGFAQCVDIREDKPLEILSFVLENEIDLTIATSDAAIMADIAGVFQANEIPIFGPSAKSAEIATNRASGKRFLYKLHAPSPKFGVFDKLQPAIDYLKDANYPLVIRRDCNSISQKDRLCCTQFSHAKYFAEELLGNDKEKIVIEDYVYGHYFTYYAVTDGYHVLPLTTVSDFYFSENGDGGLLTSGIGCYVPDIKATSEVLADIFDNVVEPTVKKLESSGSPYVGILGLDVVLKTDGTYSVLGYNPFLKDFDSQAVLNSIEEDLSELFEACANGFFADEYDDILLNDNISVSSVVRSRLGGVGIPDLDAVDSEVSCMNIKRNDDGDYVSSVGSNFILTSCAKTLSRAKKTLKDDIESIKFDGMKVRSDIYC